MKVLSDVYAVAYIGQVSFLALLKIASKHGFKAHSYADDVKLYDHAVANSCATLVSKMSHLCIGDQ